jgi:hypothetical protein
MAAYADNQGKIRILAPRGWSCRATFGTDGSSGLAVYPPGETVPSDWTAGWKLPASSPVEAIVASQTSACAGCAEGQACSLFIEAARDFMNRFGQPCPITRPKTEIVTQLDPGVVAFADPPGVAGDGSPSGGLHPANGVMTYHPGNVNGSWVETCTLPDSKELLCSITIKTFLADYRDL